MSPQIVITLATIVLAMVLFVWNRVPAVIVAVGAALVLFLTGVLTMRETLSGFGDPVVILLVSLFSIAVALEESGVAAWAGQLLLRHTGGNATWRLVVIMAVAAVFSPLMGMNGAVVAMVPIVAAIALRTATSPSKLMIPLAFACTAGANLSLLGSPVNVVAAEKIDAAGAGPFGFFAWAVVGIPQVVGTIVIVVLLGGRLLPERRPLTVDRDPMTDALLLDIAATDAAITDAAQARRSSSRAAAYRDPSAPASDHPPARLGWRAYLALAVLALLIALLAFDVVPPAIAAASCAVLMVLLRVVDVPRLVRGVDWSTCILIGAMIAPAVAMSKTGAASLLGDQVVHGIGGLGPYAVFIGLFLVTAVLSQFISNTSSALVMLPIAVATAGDLHVAALPLILGVALGASTSFVMPFANAVTLSVYGPGGYRFGDYWRLGSVVSAWAFVVAVVVVPLVWPF
ncbi:SLC13 family permease [Gryllotalpicola koreensis]|uniref:Citrate transporter-like domain-containing protein n=1 Tax=Gryllotalpicola koreensis TaxID=993086 RepID=A0ABP7ZRG5_9MICO